MMSSFLQAWSETTEKNKNFSFFTWKIKELDLRDICNDPPCPMMQYL